MAKKSTKKPAVMVDIMMGKGMPGNGKQMPKKGGKQCGKGK